MKILIIRFSSFGDVVLTTPVIRAIKEKYPEAVIDFIVYNTFSEAISLNPEIRNLVIFEKKKSKDRNYIKDTINKLKIENYLHEVEGKVKEQADWIKERQNAFNEALTEIKGVLQKYLPQSFLDYSIKEIQNIAMYNDLLAIERGESIINDIKSSLKTD